METRKLAMIAVAFFNALVGIAETAAKDIEELIGEDAGDEKPARAGRDKGRDDKSEERGTRGRRDVAEDKNGGKGGKGGKVLDVATEKEIVSATRAALKILDEDEVLKIIKKHGDGAAKATEVEPEFRQDVIDALDEAVEDANKD